MVRSGLARLVVRLQVTDVSDSQSRLSAALAGRYRLDRELGVGGMATVYLAEDPKHKRRDAIRFATYPSGLRDARSSSPQLQRMTFKIRC